MTTVETQVEDLYWDPFDTEIDANPYGVWKRMRDEAPVYRNDTLRLLGVLPLRRRRGRPPGPGHLLLRPWHGARADGLGSDARRT